MIHQQLRSILTASVILIAVSTGFAGTSKVTVPDDYAKLVPADAGVVVFIEDFGSLQTAFNQMLPEKVRNEPGNAMPDLRTDLVKTSVTIPKNEPVLIWLDALGDLLPNTPTGEAHIAFRIPGGTKANTAMAKGTPGATLVMQGDMAVVSMNMKGDAAAAPYTSPKKTGNPLLKELPKGHVAVAIEGSDFGSIARGVAPMASMAPMMLQQTLADRTKDMSKADKAAVLKAQQGLLSDVSSLIQAMVTSLSDITLMTAALTIDGHSMDIDADFAIGGVVAADHGVDPRLIGQLPAGGPMYMAIDTPTITWFTNLEIDLLDALFAKTVAEVEAFDTLMKDVKNASDMIDGGYVLTTSDMATFKTLIGSEKPKALIDATSKIFDGVNDTDMGMSYTSTGKNSWDFKMDTSKMLTELGLGDFADMAMTDGKAKGDASPQQMPDGWSITMTPGDRMVAVEQRAIGMKGDPKAGKSDALTMMDSLKGSRIIFGMAMNTLLIAEQAAEAQGRKVPKLPKEIEGMSSDASVILHAPDQKTISLHSRIPVGAIAAASAMGTEN